MPSPLPRLRRRRGAATGRHLPGAPTAVALVAIATTALVAPGPTAPGGTAGHPSGPTPAASRLAGPGLDRVAWADTAAPAAARWRFDSSATTLDEVLRATGADRLRAAGLTGAGVGVALVDTGVAPVGGLERAGLVHGADLSVDSQHPATRYLDSYGHGTHLAGIIAGSSPRLRGLAPGARLTSVRVGGANGAVDVSQVIAAVDWVVAHRDDDPTHPIRLLNLSYGTDSTQDYRLDPLAHAVENAWRAGIVVVAAAGNGGTAAPSLADPAYDPYVIAVGASDTRQTPGVADDTVTDFSSRGGAARRVDLVAPGRSIVSLRDPGSYLDSAYPQARVGDALFKGSGTSQAAAVVTGGLALLLQRDPGLRPDQVKAAVTASAHRLARADPAGQGAGALDLYGAARLVDHPDRRLNGPAAGAGCPAGSATGLGTLAGARQCWPPSTGTGQLEAARGGSHVAIGPSVLTGEYDLFGPFDTAAWARASSAGVAWRGGSWMGRELTGAGWTAADGSGSAWSGLTWPGLTWSGLTWSGLTWSGLTWSGLTWSGLTWSGLTWSGLTWSGLTWSGGPW